MPLDLPTYDVTVARDGLELDKAIAAGVGDGYATHRVMVLHADQLVAEQAGPRYGLGTLTGAPVAYTTLWCWAALRRMGIDLPEFPLFKGQVISVDRIKKADGEAAETVDPTTPNPGTDWP